MHPMLSRSTLRLHEWFTRRHILARLEELNRTQWLSRDELLALQRDKLLSLVEYASRYVPYYQRVFKDIGFQPGDLNPDLSNLGKLPILTKALIRENYQDLITIEPERRPHMNKLATSGSTGEPLVFMQDADFRDTVTADIQRHMGWGGWKLGDVQAIIWGASFKPNLKKRVRIWLIDQVWNRFSMNAFMMTVDSMNMFTKRMKQHNPRILFGYATSIYRFAQFIQNSQYRGITFNSIFTSAELLQPFVRQYIEETFQCSVFDRYGTLELGGVACECEVHTGLHISVENNYVEVWRDGHPAVPGEVGNLIVTNLNNRGMPFIRYNIGDVAALEGENVCPCGRESPRLKSLGGRIVDSFKTLDGRIVWSGFAGAAFRCLTHPTIRQFQIVQKTIDHIIVRLVPIGEIPQSVLHEISQAVRITFGDRIEVELEFLQAISPLPSGKNQYAISELNR
jgi:phenylacetate-CoA ligase